MPDIFAEQMLQPDHQRIGAWLSVAPVGAANKEKKFYDKEKVFRSTTPSTLAHEEAMESGNKDLRVCLAESSGQESRTRRTFGCPWWTDHRTATGPNRVLRRQWKLWAISIVLKG
jgi:hypothetical protein